MGTQKSVREAYMLGRDSRESARLHLQHWMWGQRLGWQLHPLIKTSKESLNIVDIGCGNACWLLEVARHKPRTWRFHGLDMSTSQFPAKELLPSNVTLQQCDVFTSIPENLNGTFDVVHVRAFTVVIPNGNPSPLLEKLLPLLRPGGYLQWDDFDAASFSAHSPNTTVEKVKTTAVLDCWQNFARSTGLDFGWVSDLAGLLQRHGLDALDDFRLPISNDLRKPSTDSFVVALEDIGQRLTSQDEGPLPSRVVWEDMFRGLLEEVQRGVTISMDMVGSLARMAR